MQTPSSLSPAASPEAHAARDTPWSHRVLWIGIALYVALRMLALVTAPQLEGSDSTSYLMSAALVLAGDLEGIQQLGPDHTPVYPLTIALVGLAGISLELAARLASFVFSLVLLVAMIGIGRRVATPMGVALGVLLLAVSPALVPLSVSVLSESVYLGTVYLGLWLFWRQMDQPRTWWAAALGGVFALSFLTRIEGLLFLGVIPLFQLAATAAARPRDGFPTLRLARWGAAYLLAFVLLAAPQVWWVSERMGGFAINGRQVWSLLSTQEEDTSGRQRHERRFSLDYSPAQPNVYYAQTDPELRAELRRGTSRAKLARVVVQNTRRLYWDQLGELVGVGVIGFFLFGLVTAWRRRAAVHVLLVGGFLSATLVGPVLYAEMAVRHLATLAPLLLLLAGEGIAFAASLLTDRHRRRGEHLVSLALAGAMVALCVLPLRAVIGRPLNPEYEPGALQEPARIIRDIREEELRRPVVLASRRMYVAEMAGVTRTVLLPYTDLEGLMTFLRLNRADLLFVEYGQLRHYEFAEEFPATPPEGLTLLYEGETSKGDRLELYRIDAAAES